MNADGSVSALLSRILLAVAVLLLLSILGGTVWGFASGRAHPGADGTSSRSLHSSGSEGSGPGAVAASDPSGKNAIFADIGVLRAATADREPVTVVISPFVTYPASDSAFREELVGKTRGFRTDIRSWIGGKTLRELTGMGEERVKASLLEVINARLVLGKVDTIYFEEYLILE
jgi:Flagellar basal body-associated protein